MKKLVKRSLLYVIVFLFVLSVSLFYVTTKNVKADEGYTAKNLAEGTFEIESGASLKLNNDGGLRFIVRFDENVKKTIKDNDLTNNIKLYFAIAPTNYFEDLDDSKINEFLAKEPVLIEVDEGKIYFEDEYWKANGCLTKIMPVNRNRSFSVIACLIDEVNQEIQLSSFENDNQNLARGTLYDVVNQAALSSYTEKVFNLTSYNTWYGTKDYPIEIKSSESYGRLIDKINQSDIFNGKNVTVKEGVEAPEGKIITNESNKPEIKQEYIISCKMGSDEEVYETIAAISGAKILETVTEPQKENYDFAGWIFEDTTVVDENSLVEGNVTIIATWTPKEYAVTHSEESGLTFTGNATATYGTNYEFSVEGTIPENKSIKVIYNNAIILTSDNGNFAIDNVVGAINLQAFITEENSFFGTGEINECDGRTTQDGLHINGTRLKKIDSSVFAYDNLPALKDGENTLLEFLTTNSQDIQNIITGWDVSFYDGTTLLTYKMSTLWTIAQKYSDTGMSFGDENIGAFVDGIYINGEKVSPATNWGTDFYTNVQGINVGVAKHIPNITLNTETGYTAYDEVGLTNEALKGFGTSNNVDVVISLYVDLDYDGRFGGVGVVVSEICNQKLNVAKVSHNEISHATFTGESTVILGEDYSFTITNIDSGYKVSVYNGSTLLSDNNGTYTISNVEGNIQLNIIEAQIELFVSTNGNVVENQTQIGDKMSIHGTKLTGESGSIFIYETNKPVVDGETLLAFMTTNNDNCSLQTFNLYFDDGEHVLKYESIMPASFYWGSEYAGAYIPGASVWTNGVRRGYDILGVSSNIEDNMNLTNSKYAVKNAITGGCHANIPTVKIDKENGRLYFGSAYYTDEIMKTFGANGVKVTIEFVRCSAGNGMVVGTCCGKTLSTGNEISKTSGGTITENQTANFINRFDVTGTKITGPTGTAFSIKNDTSLIEGENTLLEFMTTNNASNDTTEWYFTFDDGINAVSFHIRSAQYVMNDASYAGAQMLRCTFNGAGKDIINCIGNDGCGFVWEEKVNLSNNPACRGQVSPFGGDNYRGDLPTFKLNTTTGTIYFGSVYYQNDALKGFGANGFTTTITFTNSTEGHGLIIADSYVLHQ